MKKNESTMWKAIVKGPLRQRALEVACDVAERFRDPDRVVEIARVASGQYELEPQRAWTPPNVTYGHAAMALLFGQMDRCFPDQEWDRVAHNFIVPAARSLEAASGAPLWLGLFGGLAGLCFVTHYLSRNGTRYQRLLSTLEDLLFQRSSQTMRLPDPFPGGVGFGDYDVISGPTGIGAYLLLRWGVPEAAPVLDAILDCLIFLSQWRDDGYLHYFIPAQWQPTEHHLEQHPHGCTDCGLAHGVPGPLTLLALARWQGVERPGLDEAIRRLADWLAAWRYEDDWGINWPYAVPPDGVEPPPRATTRAAWCYGSPGVTSALWFAGRALQDTGLQDMAVEALRAVRRRPIPMRGIDGPILCHGVAGLLQIVLRFAVNTGRSDLVEMAHELTEQLLGLYQPDSQVGFRNLEQNERQVDDPGLLNGAAGVVLTLLAAVTDAEPAWDRMFLLS